MRLPTLSTLRAFTLLCATTLSLLACQPVMAERADKNKPLNVESDKLDYDDLKQINIFTGNVLLIKGSMVIRANRVEVHQDPEGYQYAVATAKTGELASFRQKREGVDQFIEGFGERIEYDGKADNVKFITRAYMKRLEKEKITDEVRGRIISYDSRTEFFGVEGGSGNASATNPSGRVKAVIQPKTPPTGDGVAEAQNDPLKPASGIGKTGRE
ncbi:lipopolysaccharide transport periplasmic protein LptA [Ampullimonas aquatilis]|uniref:lipopolysaccharide transport periplasmic protein LptA n=1 Tax=Ampullimonas aquatilis TaxID=1341549 RepID=UPI003C7134E3